MSDVLILRQFFLRYLMATLSLSSCCYCPCWRGGPATQIFLPLSTVADRDESGNIMCGIPRPMFETLRCPLLITITITDDTVVLAAVDGPLR